MSRYTPNLKLFCVDPVADAKNTFNITTMLNNNWDAVDTAVTARAKLDGSTPFTGNVSFTNGIKLTNGGHRLIEFFDSSGVRDGYFGRVIDVNPDFSWIGLLNLKSGKSLQLMDNGLFKYGGETVYHSGNHHTYTPLAVDGRTKVEGNLVFTRGTDPYGIQFEIPGRTEKYFIYWNASESVDNGLTFEVNKKTIMTLRKDGTGYIHEGGQARKILHEANHHTYFPVDKAGDTMTGDLLLQNGDNSVLLKYGKTGRPGKYSYLFWNANAANDYGLTFVVDGNYAMKILSNGDVYSMQGLAVANKFLHEGNHHTYLPVNKAGDTMTGDLKLSKSRLYICNTVDGDFIGNDYCSIYQSPDSLNLYFQSHVNAGDIALSPKEGTGKVLIVQNGSGKEALHMGNHHTYTPVNKAGDTMTGTLTVPGLNINAARTRVTAFDSSSVHWITYSASDDTDIISGFKRFGVKDYEFRVHSGGLPRLVFHEGNHHTYTPVAKDGSTAMSGDLLFKNGNANLGVRFGKTGRTYSSFIYWNASDVVDYGMNFVVDGVLSFNVNSNGSAYLYQGGTANVTGTPRMIHHDGNHHTYTPVALDGSTPMTGDLIINDKSVRIKSPGYDGGYARGFLLYDATNQPVYSYGFYGSVANGINAFQYAYIGQRYDNPAVKIFMNKISEFSGPVKVLGNPIQVWGTGAVDDVELVGFSEGTMGSAFSFRGDFSGSGANGNAIKMVSEWGNTTIMSWRGDGNVGIGIKSPQAPLHIKPSVVTGIQNGIILEDSGSGASEGLRVAWRVSDHAGVDLAAIDGGSSTTGGVLKLLVNQADTGAPAEKVRIEPTKVYVKTDLDVTGTLTSNGKTVMAGTYYESSTSVSVSRLGTVRVNLNMSGDRNLLLVNAKCSSSEVNVVLNGYRPNEYSAPDPIGTGDTGTRVYCMLERDTATNLWGIVFYNTSGTSITMTWRVLELA